MESPLKENVCLVVLLSKRKHSKSKHKHHTIDKDIEVSS